MAQDPDNILDQFISHSPIPMALLDASGTLLFGNHAFHALTQHTLTTALPVYFETLFSKGKKDEAKQSLKQFIGGDLTPDPVVFELTLPNNIEMIVSCYASTFSDSHILLHLINITEQKQLELRFAHSQKMQAVGQLAGGVAHDFNNLLTAMIGFCDLLLMRHPAGDQSFADIMQIKQNANRAANLVRQLLAFSRRQTLQPKIIELTDVLAELSNLVRRLIGENIELKMIHGRDISNIRADQGQLEQVLINLAVNARDAMKGGGSLTIRTSQFNINKMYPLPSDLVAPSDEDTHIPDGQYVRVEVIDTGTGIPRAMIQKIFEPFFSTKEVGSGTGLGLSTVYGIIKQTGGFVFVSSTENVGTNFSLFFPVVSNEEAEAARASEHEAVQKEVHQDLTGNCTILLVEDEMPVRTFAARALSNKGYKIIEADCAETALELMEEHGSEVELIITDVIMPGMTGPAMIEKIMPDYPDIKVIFMSGYAEEAFVDNYGTERDFNFLAKPFTLKQLASKVKDVIS
jgi:two-component system cell cycle sensor histidine kinase/response regulator CckA